MSSIVLEILQICESALLYTFYTVEQEKSPLLCRWLNHLGSCENKSAQSDPRDLDRFNWHTGS